MKIIFDDNATQTNKIKSLALRFFRQIYTLEKKLNMPIIIFQDGVNGSYYFKCSLKANLAAKLCDTNAKLDYNNTESFRANRELLLENKTYLKMENDTIGGREFNDIIVEYNTSYEESKPLKIWGGQHRISAITRVGSNVPRYHGFRIYLNLSKKQRTELALISNTNISVSNDTFDRMIEETLFGNKLRKWCQNVGFLKSKEDFPDIGSRSERITVKKARSFIVNFYLGIEKGKKLKENELDKNIYEPYLVETGVGIDDHYKNIMETKNIIKDKNLLEAGKKFLLLHEIQYKTVKDKKNNIKSKKAYRNKVMIESVLCGWSYISGLLQNHKTRLNNHFEIPKTTKKIPDPLNSEEMSNYKHDSDSETYRGLGTRSSLKDRQRIAQLFLAKSASGKVLIDKIFINKAVSTVVGLQTLARGYTSN